jgi:hypothetical protein
VTALLAALDAVLPLEICEDGARGKEGKSCVPSPPRPAGGDLRLARGFLVASDRVGLTVLVFLTTTAGVV